MLWLTVPPRSNRQAALRWAADQAEWVAVQLARDGSAEPFDPGRTIPLAGAEVRLVWDERAPRRAILADGEIRCGGPREGFSGRIERALRALALERLSAETAQVASRAGVAIRSVAVGDAQTRWGSCTASGAIRYNWRLILAPPAVLDWVVAHEVAHRVHMDHGPQFRALEARLFTGDPAEARALLRRIGPRLKRIGRRG